MNYYRYTACDIEGKRHSGVTYTKSEAKAIKELRSKGLYPIEVVGAEYPKNEDIPKKRHSESTEEMGFLGAIGAICCLIVFCAIAVPLAIFAGNFVPTDLFGSTKSNSGSYIPEDRIKAVKETSQGGDLGIIGSKKGPRAFMTAKQKEYEVTYEDKNGVIRTKTMSSDPTK